MEEDRGLPCSREGRRVDPSCSREGRGVTRRRTGDFPAAGEVSPATEKGERVLLQQGGENDYLQADYGLCCHREGRRTTSRQTRDSPVAGKVQGALLLQGREMAFSCCREGRRATCRLTRGFPVAGNFLLPSSTYFIGISVALSSMRILIYFVAVTQG